jgi:hypothetical protein
MNTGKKELIFIEDFGAYPEPDGENAWVSWPGRAFSALASLKILNFLAGAG